MTIIAIAHSVKMNTKEAILFVLEDENISKYKMAQELGCAPILVNYWLNGTKMGVQYRELFELVYKVKIDEHSSVATSNKPG